MKLALKIVVPVAILGLGAIAAGTMIANRPPVERRQAEAVAPLIRAVAVAPGDEALVVRAHGTVEPRTESQLVPQAAGRVLAVAAGFHKGGFFAEGDVLVRLDATDYALAVAQAEARVAQARTQVAREEAEAELARKEWDKFGQGAPGPLTLREPQLAEARAALAGAEASLRQARLNLERTEIRAPFAGRVRDKFIDVGQFVGVGTPLARLYALDAAEVRLPVPLDDLRYLDLPLGVPTAGPAVVLRAEVAGREAEWRGTIVRTEGEIDPRTRMLVAVARVEDPYAPDDGRPPLIVGLFVSAEIAGRTVKGAVALPRSALRGEETVLVVEADDTLRSRKVRVLRRERERVIVESGLAAGERICVSALESFGDGMKVRVQMEAP